jgi:hypothetical protein
MVPARDVSAAAPAAPAAAAKTLASVVAPTTAAPNTAQSSRGKVVPPRDVPVEEAAAKVTMKEATKEDGAIEATNAATNEAANAATSAATKEDGANERGYLEKLLVSSKPRERSTTDFYSFGKVVGTGSFAKVRVARHKLTGQLVAIKTYEKSKIKDANQLKRIASEIKVMEQLDHPLVSRFFETIESARRIHLVMEFLGEGNLCTYIKEKRKLGEDEARSIFAQLCQGLEYMHQNHYVHRDIKLENGEAASWAR